MSRTIETRLYLRRNLHIIFAKTEGFPTLPFKIDFHWKPRHQLGLIHGKQENIESISHFRRKLMSSFFDAHSAQKRVQIKFVNCMLNKMIRPQYKVGDQVCLDA